jgi:hypothetical protein
LPPSVISGARAGKWKVIDNKLVLLQAPTIGVLVNDAWGDFRANLHAWIVSMSKDICQYYIPTQSPSSL